MSKFRNLLVGALLLGAPAVASAQTVIVDDFSSWSGKTGISDVDARILPIPSSTKQRYVAADPFYSTNKTDTGSLAIDYGTHWCYYNNYCRSGGGVTFNYSGFGFGHGALDLSEFAGFQVTGSGLFTGDWQAQFMQVSFILNDPRRNRWTTRKMLDGKQGDFVVDFSLKPADFSLANIAGFEVTFGRIEGYGYSFEPTQYNAGNYNLQDFRLLGSLPVSEVPEPGSLPLLGAAAAAALVVGTRRRKRAETSKG